jgi:Z1 domain
VNSTALATLNNMARQLLTSQPTNPIDKGAVERAVAMVAPIVAASSGSTFSSDDLAMVVRALESLFVVEQGSALALKDRRRPPDWYVGERRRPGPFMSRYLQKLAEDNWPVRSVEELRDSTARVLEMLDDPQREGPWDWRGLVVGDVQSGKTAHYAGVINRAADAGYRVIVVLAGMHNVLRLQTQQRMEADFLGYDTDPDSFTDAGRRKVLGVGKINPRLIVDSLTLAVPNGGDFNVQIARQANFAPLSQPCLFVVKKNYSILKNLNQWIARLPDESRAAPLLVIDDEADQASIDTNDQPLLPDGTFDEDYDPSKINGEIRKLLATFRRSAYVAYTATPFANILMHDSRTADVYGADLFPATFIISLTAPDDYFGPTAVFGTDDDDGEDGLPIIRPIDQTAENWIPDPHDKEYQPLYQGKVRIPPSLEEAIDAFLLSCAARAVRGQDKQHHSMLVHVSRFVDVHGLVHEQVLKYLDVTRSFIAGGDKRTIDRLRHLWERDFVPTTAAIMGTVFGRQISPIAWSDVIEKLADTSDKIRVVVTNGKTKKGLDYDDYKDEGLSVIAIGGDKLSRGLTLEGLSVSYFLRVAKQYDSLLQMGRWFGYRRGFADLCRLYTTPDMTDWFVHVATANKELRSELAYMQLMLQTPKEYGLRVAGHSIMSVTAANKQRYAADHQTGYSGEGKIQTVLFKEPSLVEQNARMTEGLVEELGAGEPNPKRPGSKSQAKGQLWRGVSGRSISAFIRNFAFPPENVNIIGARLADYIDVQITMGELTEWTVFLATGDQGEAPFAGGKIDTVLRSPGASSTENRFIVRSILNRPDEAIDLDEAEFADALQVTNDKRRLEGKDEDNVPSGPSIREVRGRRPQNGLLIIYPIDPTEAKTKSKVPLIGLVVSFPSSQKALQRLYIENTVKQRGNRK